MSGRTFETVKRLRHSRIARGWYRPVGASAPRCIRSLTRTDIAGSCSRGSSNSGDFCSWMPSYYSFANSRKGLKGPLTGAQLIIFQTLTLDVSGTLQARSQLGPCPLATCIGLIRRSASPHSGQTTAINRKSIPSWPYSASSAGRQRRTGESTPPC